MDTSDSRIDFDEAGVCDHCRVFRAKILPAWNGGKGREKELQILRDRIVLSLDNVEQNYFLKKGRK